MNSSPIWNFKKMYKNSWNYSRRTHKNLARVDIEANGVQVCMFITTLIHTYFVCVLSWSCSKACLVLNENRMKLSKTKWTEKRNHSSPTSATTTTLLFASCSSLTHFFSFLLTSIISSGSERKNDFIKKYKRESETVKRAIVRNFNHEPSNWDVSDTYMSRQFNYFLGCVSC